MMQSGSPRPPCRKRERDGTQAPRVARVVGHIRRAHPRPRTPLRTPGQLEQGTGSYTRGPGPSAGSNLSLRLPGEPPALLQWPPTRQGGNEPLANLKGRRGKKKGLKEAIASGITRRGGVTSEGRKGEQGSGEASRGRGKSEAGRVRARVEGTRQERTGGDGEGTRGGQEGSWRGRAGGEGDGAGGDAGLLVSRTRHRGIAYSCNRVAVSAPSEQLRRRRAPPSQFRAVPGQPPAPGYTPEPPAPPPGPRRPPSGQHLPQPAARPGPAPLARAAAGGSQEGGRKGGREAGPAGGWAPAGPLPPPRRRSFPRLPPGPRDGSPRPAGLHSPAVGPRPRLGARSAPRAPALGSPGGRHGRRARLLLPIFLPLQQPRSLPPSSPPSLLPLAAASPLPPGSAPRRPPTSRPRPPRRPPPLSGLPAPQPPALFTPPTPPFGASAPLPPPGSIPASFPSSPACLAFCARPARTRAPLPSGTADYGIRSSAKPFGPTPPPAPRFSRALPWTPGT
nr:basic proline-rich protein-like [Ovis aries]